MSKTDELSPAPEKSSAADNTEGSGRANDGAMLWEIFLAVWKGRWVVIGVTVVFAVIAVAYALAATELYRAEVLLVPAKSRDRGADGLGELAGLANLAGLNVGDSADTVEAVAILRSRDFAREFIEAEDLLTVLFDSQWDVDAKAWKSSNEAGWPDMRDAVEFFQENVRRVSEDRRTGLITLSIEWKDAGLAAEWANLLVQRVNEYIRQRALAEAEANIAFLRRQLADTTLVSLQQSISRLLEGELRTLMLANAAEEYAFRIVDPAVTPKYRSRPRRTLLVALATLGGGLLSLTAVLLSYGWRRNWFLAA